MPQALSCLLVHLVFSTKNRERLLPPALQTELHAHLALILDQLQCQVQQIGGTEDHVHLFVSLGHTHAIAEIVDTVKTRSAEWIKARDGTPANFEWQSGYGAFSISQSETELVASYIRNQAQHHVKLTFQDEYRRLLTWYQVAFDEAQMWE